MEKATSLTFKKTTDFFLNMNCSVICDRLSGLALSSKPWLQLVNIQKEFTFSLSVKKFYTNSYSVNFYAS